MIYIYKILLCQVRPNTLIFLQYSKRYTKFEPNSKIIELIIFIINSLNDVFIKPSLSFLESHKLV